jgi:hypothetical protein
VEIDPEVIRAARREFGFDGPVTVDDGRRFLERHPGRWDLIVLDVCTGERLAFHLFTREALEAARRRLAPGGSVAVQFIGDDGPWSAAVLRTAEGVFGRCALLRPRAEVGPVGPRWLLAGPAAGVPEDAQAPWEVVRTGAPGHRLTDDRFPAERAWAEAAALWRRTHGLRD